MAPFGKNTEILGLVLVLVLLGGQSGNKHGAGTGYFGTSNAGLPIPAIPLGSFSRDMHRVVEMMDHMSSLGQMAGIPQLSGPPRSHIEGAADSVSQAVSSVQMPDMQQLMEMAGPFLAMMNGQNK
ncbi:MAG: hypothetical protein ACI4LN_01915 [Anaerovoracaceae bacterium]